MEVREAVKWFSEFMEQKLQDNDHKDDPKALEFERLIFRLKGEVAELEGALPVSNPFAVAFEAADVANFALMIAFKAVGPNIRFRRGELAPVTKTQALIAEECEKIKALLLDKNRKYGDSAIHPKRIFSLADPVEQINVRIDDKLSRIASRQADDNEDAETDLIGYLVLKRVARRVLAILPGTVVAEDDPSPSLPGGRAARMPGAERRGQEG